MHRTLRIAAARADLQLEGPFLCNRLYRQQWGRHGGMESRQIAECLVCAGMLSMMGLGGRWLPDSRCVPHLQHTLTTPSLQSNSRQ